MLRLASVGKDDVVYDLGSGDGRIVIMAAERYGAKGVGFELDPDLVRRSNENARRAGVAHLVEFRQQDAMTADLSPATVVTIYLGREANLRFRPALQSQLRPGAVVVSMTLTWATGGPRRFGSCWTRQAGHGRSTCGGSRAASPGRRRPAGPSAGDDGVGAVQ